MRKLRLQLYGFQKKILSINLYNYAKGKFVSIINFVSTSITGKKQIVIME